MGVFFAKVIGRNLGQYMVVIIMCIMLLLLSLLFSAGSVNVLKYYYIQKYEQK